MPFAGERDTLVFGVSGMARSGAERLLGVGCMLAVIAALLSLPRLLQTSKAPSVLRIRRDHHGVVIEPENTRGIVGGVVVGVALLLMLAIPLWGFWAGALTGLNLLPMLLFPLVLFLPSALLGIAMAQEVLGRRERVTVGLTSTHLTHEEKRPLARRTVTRCALRATSRYRLPSR